MGRGRTEQLVVKFLSTLSPYLTTTATTSPPAALSTTRLFAYLRYVTVTA